MNKTAKIAVGAAILLGGFLIYRKANAAQAEGAAGASTSPGFFGMASGNGGGGSTTSGGGSLGYVLGAGSTPAPAPKPAASAPSSGSGNATFGGGSTIGSVLGAVFGAGTGQAAEQQEVMKPLQYVSQPAPPPPPPPAVQQVIQAAAPAPYVQQGNASNPDGMYGFIPAWKQDVNDSAGA